MFSYSCFKWTQTNFPSTGGKLLILYLYCFRKNGCPIRLRGRSLTCLSTVPLHVGEVYKRLRSQVRGSQSRQSRCLNSALKVVLVPCIFEHNLKSYVMLQPCEDVFRSVDQKHRKQTWSHWGWLQATYSSRAHLADYLAQGFYYSIVAQIDDCLGCLKLMFMFFQDRCFPHFRSFFVSHVTSPRITSKCFTL